jgi:diguanylate cyclase (GGDEF)-like protein
MLLMSVGLIAEQRITTGVFAKLEADQVAQDAQRVRIGLEAWESLLRSYGATNSTWDNSYDDLAHSDRRGFQADLAPDMVSVTGGLDGVIGVGPDGGPRLGGMVRGDRYDQPPAGLASAPDLARLFDPRAAAGAGRCGVVTTATTPFLFCGFAAHRSDGGNAVSGGLIYLKSLGGGSLAGIGAQIQMPLKLVSGSTGGAGQALTIDSGMGPLRVSTRTVSSSRMALDITVTTVGGPGIVLEAIRPRLIYQHAVSVSYWLMFLMGLLGCLLIAVVLLMMRREVRYRVRPLHRVAVGVIESGDRTLRVGSTGHGELRALAGAIDSMLDSMAVQDESLRRALAREHEQAITDPLTGLTNRAGLTHDFEQALVASEREGTTVGLLLIDLDRFKEVNDTLGHECGDRLLAQIGPRVAAALRVTDTVCRLGGDEFSVLLPDVDGVEDAVAIAHRLRATLVEPFLLDGVEVDVEASIGVVVSGEHGKDVTALLRRAEVAMYVAKSQILGVFAYERDVDTHSPQRLTLLSQLRRGLDRGELVLDYQPKVYLATGEVAGAEALVRWRHPDRGLVPPDEFLPLAEGTGLIGPLTLYVLDAALRQAALFAAAGHPIPIAVNLSPRNLLDPGLCVQVTRLLIEHGVPAQLLELEVTETAIMTEPARAGHLLRQLSDLGIRIAIDDFGAGYTSLAQLRTLPVAELKVDRSFVLTMDTDLGNAVIVESIIELGHNLGLTIVAEGVETARSVETLVRYGCDIAQGYHLSRPLPPDEFLRWCTDRSTAHLS